MAAGHTHVQPPDAPPRPGALHADASRRQARRHRPAVPVCLTQLRCSRSLPPCAERYPRLIQLAIIASPLLATGRGSRSLRGSGRRLDGGPSTEGPRSRRSGPIASGKASAMALKPLAALAAQGAVARVPLGCGRQARSRHGTEIAATRAPQGSSGEPRRGFPGSLTRLSGRPASEGLPGRHGTGPRAAERRPRDPSHQPATSHLAARKERRVRHIQARGLKLQPTTSHRLAKR